MRRLRQAFLQATLYPADPVTQRNARNSLIDGMAFNVVTGCFLPYVGAFVLSLGGNAFAVGLAASLPALVQTVAQLPGARIVSRQPRRLPVVLRWNWASRLAYVPLGAVPFLPISPDARVALFLLLYAYMSFPATVGNVAWTALMAELFPPHLRGRIFADRNMWLTLVTLLSSALGGALVLILPWPGHYLALIAITFAGQMVSMRYLARLQERPAGAEGGRPEASPARASAEARRGGWSLFWTFTLAAFVFQAGWALPQGIWPILFLRIDGLHAFWFGVWNVVSSLFTVLCARWWGRFYDLRGPFAAAGLAAALFVVFPPAYLVARTGLPITLLNILTGVAVAGINLSLFNGLLEVAPDDRRPQAVAWFNFLIGLANFAAPLLGTFVFEQWGLSACMWCSATLRLAGAIFLAWPAVAPTRRMSRTATSLVR